MSEALVPLDPNSPEAKNAILALLGSTLAELKQIDKNVVGSSKDIRANKTNLQDVFNITDQPTVNSQLQSNPQVIPVQPTGNTLATITTVVQQQPAQVPVQSVSEEDPNQLVFDFTKKITPDTINDKLDRILDKLDRLIDILK
jgi:hypothetical protein